MHTRAKGGILRPFQRFGVADFFARGLLGFHERLHVEL